MEDSTEKALSRDLTRREGLAKNRDADGGHPGGNLLARKQDF